MGNPVAVELKTMVVFDTVTVTTAATATSVDIDLHGMRTTGLFSLQVKNTGDGSLAITYQVSNDGNTWVTPAAATAICSGFTKTSGPGSSSTEVFAFAPIFARRIRFVATATTTDCIVLATLAVQ